MFEFSVLEIEYEYHKYHLYHIYIHLYLSIYYLSTIYLLSIYLPLTSSKEQLMVFFDQEATSASFHEILPGPGRWS